MPPAAIFQPDPSDDTSMTIRAGKSATFPRVPHQAIPCRPQPPLLNEGGRAAHVFKPLTLTTMIRHQLPCGLRSALLLAAFLAAPFAAAEETSPNEALRQGLYQEEVKRDPEAAAKHYQEVLEQYAKQQAVAATALFRLAEVRRGQGKNDDAIRLYQQLLAGFPNAGAEAKLAREQLAKLGGKIPEAPAAAVDEEEREIARLTELKTSAPDLARNDETMVEAVRKHWARVVEWRVTAGLVAANTGAVAAAAEAGDLRILNLLLDAGIHSDASGAVFKAAEHGHAEIEKTLLEKAGKECVAGGGQALALAVKKGYAGIVRAYLDAGVDPNWQPDECVMPRNANIRDFEWEGTPLITAIANNRMDIVELLLEAKADAKLRSNTTGISVLHAAANLKEPAATELVPRLIALGADPNAPNRSVGGWPAVSPLRYALESWGNFACAKALASHGANLKEPGLFDPFVTKADDESTFPHERRRPRLEFLLTIGADPNVPNANGEPPLFHVVTRGDVELLKLFLRHGADANVKIAGWKQCREPGHGNPFVPTTGKREEIPGSLLACLPYDKPEVAIEITRLLLDAGTKADGWLGPVIDRVARLDESGELVRRLLAQRPDYVNVMEMPGMTEWRPASRRVILDELLIPALSKEKGVLLLDATTGRWRPLAKEPGTAAWPDLAGLLWQNLEMLLPDRSIHETTADGKRKYKTVNYWPRLTIFQTSAKGNTRTAVPLKGDEPFPPLRPDMVIEFADEGGQSLKSKIEPVLDWHLRKRIRVPVTIEQGGKSREVTMCGNLLVFDPTSAEIPLLNIGGLARMFLPKHSVESDLALKSGTVFTIRRKDGREVRVDAGGENISFVPMDSVTRSYLLAGDRLIIPKADWTLMRDPVVTAELVPPIRVAVPEWSFHRSYFMGAKSVPTPPQSPASSRSSRPSERTPAARPSAPPPPFPPPTLLELLADVLSPELDRFVEDRKLGDDDIFAALATESDASASVKLPHPDFSSILIKRPKDGGGETVINVDLSPLIARCQDDTDPAEIRKSDVPLVPGDTVEFSLHADKLSQPWTGLGPAEERLFRKAIGGRITLREPDGVIHDFDLVYQQPAWRATPAGLLPFAPENGSPSTRASRVRFSQRSTGNIYRGEAVIDSGSFLREGDRMQVGFYDHATARVRSPGQPPTRRVPKVLDIPYERGCPAR